MLEITDLVREIGYGPPPRTPDQMWRSAVHEAGHVIAYNTISPDLVLRVRLNRHSGNVLGTMTELNNDILTASVCQITMAGVRQHLAALLAGRAAEIELIGTASGGSGGGPNSDLAQATRFATQALACYGLGDVDLTYRGEARDVLNPRFLEGDRELRQEVSWLLASCYDEARQLIRERRETVTQLAQLLVEKLDLTALEVRSLLEQTLRAASEADADNSVDEPRLILAGELGGLSPASNVNPEHFGGVGQHPQVSNDD
jgi:ATP-dependent Zn protease